MQSPEFTVEHKVELYEARETTTTWTIEDRNIPP